MTKTIKIILIVAAVFLVGFLIFYFSSKEDTSSSLVVQSPGSPLTPKVDSSDATAFLSTLLSLNRIKIDTTLFNSQIFTKLKDNTVPILNEGGVGRSNPFAEIGASNTPVDDGMNLPQINNGVSAKSTTSVN